MPNVFVTGGAGFIGSHIVDALIARGFSVTVIDNLSSGRKENINSAATFVQADIVTDDLLKLFEAEKPIALFHLCAQMDIRKSLDNPAWDSEQNIIGSLRLFEFCKQYQTKVIFSSSGGAILNSDIEIVPTPETAAELPCSPYGVAKLAIEKYLHYYHIVHGLPYVALRYANVYGPRQGSTGEAGVVSIFCKRFLANEAVVIYGDGSQTRDFVYVADVVAANMAALDSSVIGPYNIATAKETTVNELAALLKTLTLSTAEITHAPERVGEQRRSCLSYEKAKRELAWEPRYDIAQGLTETVAWFKNNLA